MTHPKTPDELRAWADKCQLKADYEHREKAATSVPGLAAAIARDYASALETKAEVVQEAADQRARAQCAEARADNVRRRADAAEARLEEVERERDEAEKLVQDIQVARRAEEADLAIMDAKLRAAEAEAKRLREALTTFQSYGCPVCNGGDCASANPTVSCCPMQEARAALSGADPREAVVAEIAANIACRFGCQSPAAYIVHAPQGCICWPDPVHAVCEQHWLTMESSGPIRVIARLRAGGADNG